MSAVLQLRPWLGPCVAGLALLLGGVGYRVTSAAVAAELAATIRLPQPLATLPLTIGVWEGEDVPIRESTQKIAMNDDFVNRRYRNRETGQAVSLYIGYTARPRTMLRHRPTVCYPSAGWSHLGTRTVELPLSPAGSTEPQGGSPRSVAELENAGPGSACAPDTQRSGARASFPALVHEFLKLGPTAESRMVVLNYYILNGVPTVDENSFWSLGWRDPNRARDATRYVAQVQVAAAVRTTPDGAAELVRRFAGDSAPAILPLLPATAGRDAAAAGAEP